MSSSGFGSCRTFLTSHRPLGMILFCVGQIVWVVLVFLLPSSSSSYFKDHVSYPGSRACGRSKFRTGVSFGSLGGCPAGVWFWCVPTSSHLPMGEPVTAGALLASVVLCMCAPRHVRRVDAWVCNRRTFVGPVPPSVQDIHVLWVHAAVTVGVRVAATADQKFRLHMEIWSPLGCVSCVGWMLRCLTPQ